MINAKQASDLVRFVPRHFQKVIFGKENGLDEGTIAGHMVEGSFRVPGEGEAMER